MPTPRAYLANALFCLGDRLVNDLLADALRSAIPSLELFVPQESAEINDKRNYADSIMIARHDSGELMRSDFLVAVLDGTEIDPGVACEIGKFTGTGGPVFALFTDIRQTGRDHAGKLDALVADITENQFPYRNLYVVGEVKLSGGGVFADIASLVAAAAAYARTLTRDSAA